MIAGKALAGLKAGIAANARRADTMCSMVDPALHREEHAILVEALRSATLSLIDHAARLQDPQAMEAAVQEIGLYRSVLRRHEGAP